MSRYVDLGPARDETGLLVVLPGRGYHPDKPLLRVAAEVAADLRWRVRQVWWEAPDDASPAWAGAELAAAAQGYDGPIRVLAKSIGSFAAPAVAASSYPACWLTPLLGQPAIVEGIRANVAAQMVVGGTADSLWDSAVAATLPGEVLELPGANHSLAVTGRRNATASAHAEFVRGLSRWLG
jgi:hypothetical protein